MQNETKAKLKYVCKLKNKRQIKYGLSGTHTHSKNHFP